MATMGVYAIRNMVTDRTYIGSSINVSARLHQHRCLLRATRHPNKILQGDWDAFGDAAFETHIVTEVELASDLPASELAAMARVIHLYNIKTYAGTSLKRHTMDRSAYMTFTEARDMIGIVSKDTLRRIVAREGWKVYRNPADARERWLLRTDVEGYVKPKEITP